MGARSRGLARRRAVAERANRGSGVFMAGKTKKKAEAEPAEADSETDAKPKSKLSRKMIIMAAAALIVIGGAGGYMVFFSGHGAKEAKETTKEAAAKPATFVDLPDVLVNLANSGSDRTQYLKVKVVLELPEADLVERIKPLMPRVMDAFQTYLRELRPTDLDGSAGLYRLKEELTRRVNAVVAPNHITAVLFKEIVVQ
jgi:flagellar FliL protein